MANLYDDFEKRFTSSFFSADWVEMVSTTSGEPAKNMNICRKSLQELEGELELLKSDVDNISFKLLKLENLAEFYK